MARPIVVPTMSMNTARVIAGGGSFALTVLVFVAIIFRPELAKDDLFKMLAQAVVIQGLVGLVMAFLFTGNQTKEEPPRQVDIPRSTAQAADQVADAAAAEADRITGGG